MRKLDPELQARLDSGVTTLCACWRIDRRDGRTFGFTDHDCPLHFDGVTFEPASASTSSAIEVATGLAADSLEMTGALRSDAISDADLARGLFDGARVRRWLVDWRRPDLRTLSFSGTIGEITRSGGAFRAEVLGLAAALNRPMGRAYLPTCDAVLGDVRCGVDLDAPAYRASGVVVDHGVRGFGVSGLAAHPPGWFARGRLTWTSGASAGLSATVREDHVVDAVRRIHLWVSPPSVALGDGFEIVAGCDKLADTCRAKFFNFLNFRGFPDMPGEDWITAYPASADRHDGGSLRG